MSLSARSTRRAITLPAPSARIIPLLLLASALSACGDAVTGLPSDIDAGRRRVKDTPVPPPPAPPIVTDSSTPNLLSGAALWVDPFSNARRTADGWRVSRPADAAQMDKVAARRAGAMDRQLERQRPGRRRCRHDDDDRRRRDAGVRRLQHSAARLRRALRRQRHDRRRVPYLDHLLRERHRRAPRHRDPRARRARRDGLPLRRRPAAPPRPAQLRGADASRQGRHRRLPRRRSPGVEVGRHHGLATRQREHRARPGILAQRLELPRDERQRRLRRSRSRSSPAASTSSWTPAATGSDPLPTASGATPPAAPSANAPPR